jgi:hypothetical protein
MRIGKAIAALALLGVLTSACSSGGAANKSSAANQKQFDPAVVVAALSKPRAVTQFVGTVEGSNAYAAVVDSGDGRVKVYLCDGKKLGSWFGTKLTDGAFTAVDNEGQGLDVTGRIDGDAATGTLTFADGTKHSFRAERSSLPAGLYELTNVESGKVVSATTIVLPDGSSRGLFNGPGSKKWCTTLKASIKASIQQAQGIAAQPGAGAQDAADIAMTGALNANSQYISHGCDTKTGSAL